MSEHVLNEHLRKATVEAVATYTVGIAVENNTGIGTGTLITYRDKHYVLTAAHVIGAAKAETIRFWPRPPKAIIEKAAKDTTDEEVGAKTLGQPFPIVAISTTAVVDVAVLEIDPTFELPPGAEFYDLRRSVEFAEWNPERIDGLSLFIFGFPADNSREVENTMQRYLGCATFVSPFSKDENAPERWKGLDNVDSASDFLFTYPISDDWPILPHGFSGSGVWVASDILGRAVWSSEPVLIGVTHSYFRQRKLIAATQLPHVVGVFLEHIQKKAEAAGA
jgi:hypothetical protein